MLRDLCSLIQTLRQRMSGRNGLSQSAILSGATALLMGATSASVLAQSPQYGYGMPAVGGPGYPAAGYSYGGPGTIRQTAMQFGFAQDESGPVDAENSPTIERLFESEFKMEIERRHSQLILTNRRIRRIAVTDANIANYVQYSEKEISVVGLELGKTDLTLWFADDDDPQIYEITVIRDESLEEQRRIDFGRLERRLDAMYPNSDVELEPLGTQVIVRGLAYDQQEANNILQIVRSEVLRNAGQFDDLYGNGRNGINGINGNNGNNNRFGNGGLGGLNDIIINELTVPGQYNVKLRVVVAKIDREQLREMGIDWTTIFNDGRHTLTGNLGAAANGPTLSGIFENGEINAIVRWLASNGTATLVSEPNLVMLSGHTASLLSGGEFAVPSIVGLGGGQTTFFRGFGTQLLVTPTVVDRDLFRLSLFASYSVADAGNAVGGVPGTNGDSVQTTVELREGQTMAIGGLISRQMATEVTRIPLLGDIPFIGSRLFHAKRATEDETELIVLVSPEIVAPMDPDQVPPLPNYYVTHPNDDDLYKYARTEGNPDLNVYQLRPFGSGATYGVPQGYSLFNPSVTHPGFTQSGGQVPGALGGHASGSGELQSLTPQPDYSLPPAGHQPMSPLPPTQVPSAMPPQQQYLPPQQPMMLPPSSGGNGIPLPPSPGISVPQARTHQQGTVYGAGTYPASAPEGRPVRMIGWGQ